MEKQKHVKFKERKESESDEKFREMSQNWIAGQMKGSHGRGGVCFIIMLRRLVKKADILRSG